MSNQPGRAVDQYPPPPNQQQAYSLPPPPLPPPPPSHQQRPGYPAQAQQHQQDRSSQSQQPDMVTLPPPPHVQQHDMYNRPPPQGAYDPYSQQPPPIGYGPQQPPQQQPQPFNQPAPRQRTAIACRYCRRRKIRCYGFDTNPDGRCQNCSRFNQDCVFTPVSSQTHAFVPAHTAYPQLRNQGRFPQGPDGRPVYPQQGPPIYGAHGQPLGPVPPPPQHSTDPHYPPPPGPHQPYQAPAPYPTAPPPNYDPRAPLPHQQSHHDDRRSSAGADYNAYPTPNSMTPVSPSSQQSYQNNTYPNSAGSYYPPQQDQSTPTQRRPSPPGNYGYNSTGRTSTSPHASVSNLPPGPLGGHYGSYPGGLHPPQVLPPANDGRNPSPGGQTRDRGRIDPMSVQGVLEPPGRSNTDSNMLNRLNSKAP